MSNGPPGTPGQELTVADVVAALPQNLGDIDEPIAIDVGLTVTEPQVGDDEVAALAQRANEVTGGTITLNAGGSSSEVDGPVFRPAFGLAIEEGAPRLTMQSEPVAQILAEEVPGRANPTGVRFEIGPGGPVPVGGEDAQVCCTDDAPQKIVDDVLRSQFTRVPVWQDQPDNIVGVLHSKDLLAALGNCGWKVESLNLASGTPHCRPVILTN